MITPGNHLYLGSDGRWRCAWPDDRFTVVHGPHETLAQLQTVLHVPDPTAVRDHDRGNEPLRSALDALVAQGIAAERAEPPARTRTARVHLAGDGPIAEELVRLLDQTAEVHRFVHEDLPVDDADVVVSVAGWLPDTRWRDLDARLRRAAVAWHCCHVEADAFVVGPLYVPSRTAGYRDVRARRLAAAPAPDELLGLWAYLDSTQPKPPRPWHDGPWPAVVAGLLAADVGAYLDGRPVPTEGHQLLARPRTGTVQRHRVLPLPPLAAAPEAAPG